MSDLIQVLPDAVANQIAAGEVIQRPGSVVKELMENSIDSGATRIQVIIKDAGKTLVQVTDNGCGMSESDARLCFERHATSKIRKADDLFLIRTMGFRGEAMAAIAAVAQVELKTKTHEAEAGTRVVINGSEFELQEPSGCSNGTSISVKNLFYNIPARRKFLKAPSTELNQIITEFQRIALAYPNLSFILVHNDSEIYNLPAARRLERIVHLFGKTMNQSLVSLKTDTSIIQVSGYIGKPESARRRYGEQFFFVNSRFMKHPYLHRAVVQSYESLIPPDTVPPYFVFLEIDPSQIDVNIHPTKTEIKFEDERAVYQILQASVREALGKFNLAPTLDFNQEGAIDIPVFRPGESYRPPFIQIDPGYNPFEPGNHSGDKNHEDRFRYAPPPVKGWESLFPEGTRNAESDHTGVPSDTKNCIQLKNKYIMVPVKSGIMMVHQSRAMERILYEDFLRDMENPAGSGQQVLFPATFEVNQADLSLLTSISGILSSIGLDLEPFGGQSVIIRGMPASLENQDPKWMIDQLLDQLKNESVDPGVQIKDQVARGIARVSARSMNRPLGDMEMQVLVDRLFACNQPQFTPGGKAVLTILQMDELERRFQ